jgi:uncharacterized protein YoxC
MDGSRREVMEETSTGAQDPGMATEDRNRSTGGIAWVRVLPVAVALLAIMLVVLVVVNALSTSSRDERIESLEDRVTTLATQLDAMTGVVIDQSRSRSSVERLASDVEDLDTRVTEIEDTSKLYVADIDRVASCLNDYMDTIAASRGGSYTYDYCIVYSSFR